MDVEEFKKSVGQRLKTFIKSKGMNQKEFANTLGITNSALSNVTSGSTGISSQVLREVSSMYPDLNVDWLIKGRGNMITMAQVIGENNHVGNFMGNEQSSLKEIQQLRSEIKNLKEQLLLKDKIISLLESKK